MRDDAVGLFWEELPVSRGGQRARIMPAIPETGWQTPREFPNLSAAPYISLDTETKDPELKTHGPGWARGAGHIVGVSLSVPGHAWYFPMRHEVEPEHNMDPDKVLAFLGDTLVNPKQDKIGANLGYDLGWLRQEGIKVKGRLFDVLFAEALLEENKRINLDRLAESYLGRGKTTNLLYEWCSRFYGGKADDKQRANIYRTPPRLAGHYAEDDALLPALIMQHQYPRLHSEGLVELFDMECTLIRLVEDMRFAGVNIDIGKMDEAETGMALQVQNLQEQFNTTVGFECSVDSNNDLVQAFEKLGVPYGKTPAGNPSFAKDVLEQVDHPIGQNIIDLRKLNKTLGTFFKGLRGNVDGTLYGQFHLLRGGGKGTVSGRFSSSQPNLQNIPSRDPVIAPLLRGLFIPDHGHMQWRSYDYSQIEYRFLAHFAVGPGSDDLRQKYLDDPDTDYHDATIELVENITGVRLDRKPVKNINFGLLYGMGKPKLARSIGLAMSEATTLFEAYHSGAPFVNATFESVKTLAEEVGLIRTILGRRCRFDMWEPKTFSRTKYPALSYGAALSSYGLIKRAYSHKALNRLLQGSAADMMKKAMYDCYVQGIFDETGIPRLTVHDELNFSDPGGVDAAFNEMQHVMESCIPLRVPINVDYEYGPSWGDMQKAA